MTAAELRVVPPPALPDAAITQLCDSGLTLESIEWLRSNDWIRYPTTKRELLKLLARKRWNKADTPEGLAFRFRRIPVHPEGDFWRVRMKDGWTPKSPKLDRNGAPRKAKYIGPTGSGTSRLYIPPFLEPAKLTDPSLTFNIVEGEKKSLCLAQFLPRVVGFCGVTMLHDKPHRDRTGEWKLLPDFEFLKIKGSCVRLIVDADFDSKPEVEKAMRRAAGMVLDAGAKSVSLVVSPVANGDTSSGIDDVVGELMKGGW